MRKLLLASVATLGTAGGFVGSAMAQGTVGAPNQGQVAYPMAPSHPAAANNNNNYQAPALPGRLTCQFGISSDGHLGGWKARDSVTAAAAAHRRTTDRSFWNLPWHSLWT